MPSVEEAIAEEQSGEDIPGLEESYVDEACKVTGPANGHSLVHEPVEEMEPIKEDPIAGVESSMHATEQSTLEEMPTEVEEAVEAEPFTEAKPAAEEPVRDKSVEEEPTTEPLATGLAGVTHAQVEQTMEHQLTQDSVADIEPAKEIDHHLGKSALEDESQSEINPAKEGLAIEAERTKEAEAEPALEHHVHEPAVEDLVEHSIAEHPVANEPAVEELVTKEPAPEEPVAEDNVEMPIVEQSVAKHSIEEKEATTAEPDSEKLLVGESTATEPLAESKPAAEDASLKFEPHKEAVEQSKEVDATAEEELSANEPAGEEHGSTEKLAVAAKLATIPGPVMKETAVENSAAEEMNGQEATGEPSVVAEAAKNDPATEEPITEQSANETEPTNLEKTAVDVEPTPEDKLVEDVDPVTAVELVLEEPSAAAEKHSDIETHAAKSDTEVEPVNEVFLATKDEPSPETVAEEAEPAPEEPIVNDTIGQDAAEHEPAIHEPAAHEPILPEEVVDKSAKDEPAVNESTVMDEPTVHEPAAHEPVLNEETVDESVMDEPAAEETAPDDKIEDPSPSAPTKAPPSRVDSGIEVESPTEIKSDVSVEPLRTVVEDSPVEEPTGGPTTKEQTMDEPAVEAKSISEEAPEGFQNPLSEPAGTEPVVHDPAEEGHLFDAVDKSTAEEPETKTEPAPEQPLSILSHTMASLLPKTTVNGDFHAETPEPEGPTTAPHVEKDVHVDAKPATREQHTRVDSGIDVEAPTKEPLGKLEPVVEVRPAAEIEPGLGGAKQFSEVL
jgi:hypothetical protein